MKMRRIRCGCFETNSSSVHSICMSAQYLEDNHLPMNRDGYIWGSFGNFGREYVIYKEQSDKLAYLLTQCYYAAGRDYELFIESQNFEMVQEAVCNYTGAKGIKFSQKEIAMLTARDEDGEVYDTDHAYIDHQSVPYNSYGDVEFIDLYSEDEIIGFVFGKGVYLKTDCD